MKGRSQTTTAPAQEPESYSDSPYLLSDEAARFLRFGTRALFVKWAKRNRVPECRRGRTLLYKRAVLEAFIEGKAWTRDRHTAKVAPFAANRLRNTVPSKSLDGGVR